MRDFSRCFYHHNAIRISVWVDGEFEKSRHSFAIFAHYYFDIFFFHSCFSTPSLYLTRRLALEEWHVL